MKSKKLRSSTIYSLRSTIFLVPLALLGLNLLALDALLIPRLLPGQPSVLASTTSAGGSCPQACVTLINQSGGKTGAAKESIIPLGSGTNATGDWTDVAGTSVALDSAQYGTIKKVTFEASVGVPTGNQRAYVRLYNVTDAHPIWYSDMSMDGTGPTTLTSPATLVLGTGTKTYIVQMKSQLKFPTNLVSARLRIISQ